MTSFPCDAIQTSYRQIEIELTNKIYTGTVSVIFYGLEGVYVTAIIPFEVRTTSTGYAQGDGTTSTFVLDEQTSKPTLQSVQYTESSANALLNILKMPDPVIIREQNSS